MISKESQLSSAGVEDEQEVPQEVGASTNQSLVPSSLGFTFCVDASVKNLELTASWGRYKRTERIEENSNKPNRCWKRIPSGGTTHITMDRQKLNTSR